MTLDADEEVDERSDVAPKRPKGGEPGKRNLSKNKVKGEKAAFEGQVLNLLQGDINKVKVDDEDELFLHSLLGSFKKCGANKDLVKIKVMQIMLEHQEKKTPQAAVPVVAVAGPSQQNQMVGGGGDHRYSQGFNTQYQDPNMYYNQGPTIIHDAQRSYQTL